MMNISSCGNTNCFDYTIGYLDWFNKTFDHQFYFPILELKVGISLLKTFDMYIRKCKRRGRNQGMCLEYDKEGYGDAKSDSLRLGNISFRIQHLVWGIMHGLDSAFLRYIQSGVLDLSDIRCELTRFEETMRLFFVTDIKESGIIDLLLNNLPGDLRLVMDFIASISKNLKLLIGSTNQFDSAQNIAMPTLQEKLIFLMSFIRFVMLQGVEGQQLIDLLVHVHVLVVNAVSLICRSWFQRIDEQVCNEMKSEISQLIHKMIDPDDPQVREIYTHVLKASKLSRSSYTLALKENKHLVAEFIYYLLHSIMELLESYTSFPVPVKHQMQKLHEGVRFLSILLSQQQEKFDELNDEMKDLIGVVVADAGILTFSLSLNEVKQGLLKETNLALSHLLEVLKFILAEVAHIYPLSQSFPKANELDSIDFLLETLKEVESSTADSFSFPNHQIHTILEDLAFLRSFLGNIKEQRNQNENLQALWSRVMKVAYSAELEIDSALVGDHHEHCLDVVAENIKLMKIEAKEIYDSIRYDGETQRVTKFTINMPSQVTAPISNKALIGLNDEVESIINRLTRGSSRLDVVAIVGMPGLGKTTIAEKVYNDHLVNVHFHIRAWCCVSHTYTKHSLLIQLLCSIDYGSSVQYREMNEDEMADKLRKLLKRNRYLIVLDDVWDIYGWDLLKHSLPDDCRGSRILLTSRFHKLSLQINPDSEPYHLRPLTDHESCELLQRKLFAKEDCPPTLSEVVLHAAKYCKGLPLAVVLVAGILATFEPNCWEEVTTHLNSSIFVDDEHCMMTLEHSYNYLPDYLKPCLLYLGTFQEDQDIPVRKLLWLWISEGFVRKTEGKSLKDMADDYLMDLIGRSLVMATQQRSLGGIKACRIHDLVHEFCVKKAKEEHFLQILQGDDLLTFTGPCNPHRLYVSPSTRLEPKESMLFLPNLRCLLFSDSTYTQLDIVSRDLLSSKLLRVLDCGRNLCSSVYFSREVVFLVHLRYLKIELDEPDIPSAIANLSRLEVFVLGGPRSFYSLPNTIWNIKTLRRLVVSWLGIGFRFSTDNLEGTPDLKHLDTLTLAIDLSSQGFQKILTKLPSIRRLGCAGLLESTRNHDGILVLDHLSGLESLKISCFDRYEFEFPLNLKKLTLSNNRQPWSKISAIGKLPNLVVLKLFYDSFLGDKWEMEEGEFRNLRFLKLSELDISWWTSSSDNFSCLEKLVLHDCWKLEEVPSCLGETLTLDMIEVQRCPESAVNSVEQILQEQREWGNEGIKSVIVKMENWQWSTFSS